MPSANLVRMRHTKSGSIVRVTEEKAARLDRNWKSVTGGSSKATAPAKAKRSAPDGKPSTKADWLALGEEMGLELDPKATKGVIVAAVTEAQEAAGTVDPDGPADDDSQ
jgi:hypothetical protein